MRPVKRTAYDHTQGASLYVKLAAFLLLGLIFPSSAVALDVIVEGPDGEPVNGFRWLVEEDATFPIDPGVYNPDPLATRFHTSYMPIVKKGHEQGSTAVINLNPLKKYFVSVLPDAGYSMGGASVGFNQNTATVVVQKQPIPTAQITVFAFEDIAPINNAPDGPQERGLEGFNVLLFDAGGRYGVSGGQMMMDAFGNPLGTTYNPDGSVKEMGNSIIKTGPDGTVTIKNLHPAKYGVQIVPPAGEGWIQTTTIEGSKTIDAWVKANEPPFFIEFGAPLYHIFMGFVRPFSDPGALNGSSVISGQVTNLHLGRPPAFSFNSGASVEHTIPWVGLNDLGAGTGKGIFAKRANADGTFSIPNVPEGLYQLVVWDEYLDFIIAFTSVDVPAGGGSVDIGDVPVFQWFTRLDNYVFYDYDEDGFRDPGEPGIPEQAINIRFRDGSVYDSMPTDLDGFVPFDQVFPFFHWQVAEVDFARYKATGATITVDAGGPIDENDPWSFGGKLNPQLQPDNNNMPYRTETGVVLTQAFQGHLGQTNVIEWGKKVYSPGENGGISGIVFYAVTRAEDDPRFAAAEEWEPGIPRVVVNLYEDRNRDKVIDDLNNDGVPTLADVDNYPFGNFPGPEDIDRNGNLVFEAGDAVQIATTDSWDDSLPGGCPGDPQDPFYLNGRGQDNMRNWNQVRPGVFDGGYAFDSFFPGGIDSGSSEVSPLRIGTYIVEAVPPRGPDGSETYEILKEEDKNVDFGEEYDPEPGEALPPPCVGDLHLVPAELTLFPGVAAPFAGEWRPLSDRKQITLYDMQNAAVDFFFCTQVPIAAHIIGQCTDDINNEFNVNAPLFGEKYAPPYLPIAIRDWSGREISRFYSDQWGKYNALVPSTFTANLAIPSGMGPNMLVICLNDAGPIPDPDNPGEFITDPYHNPQYNQPSYTFQYMVGTTTYLDTPIFPVSAFAGSEQFPVDCEFPSGTPKVRTVTSVRGGPYVYQPGAWIRIFSEGLIEVLNPEYDGPSGSQPRTVKRDYGFGSTPGTVTINGVPLTDVTWNWKNITGRVGSGTTSGQLVVTRGDNGKSSPYGVRFTVGTAGSVPQNQIRYVFPSTNPDATPIQDAIDAALPGDGIFVTPGVYNELVIMWKPVRLQGFGASATINATKSRIGNVLEAWRAKVDTLIATGEIDLLPGQENLYSPTGLGNLYLTEEGPAIIVLGKDASPSQGGYGLVNGVPNAWIDGFTITGADHGGGIFVNGYIRNLEISNCRIAGNQGYFGGGIRVGHPYLTADIGQGPEYVDGQNDNIKIRYNHITQNGGLGGFGGGVSLNNGADFYEVTGNFICGNLSQGEGAGIGHYGLNESGLIAGNTIFFNQCFTQGRAVSGGGIFIGGAESLDGAGTLTPGAGSVKIIGNLIQGNMAGAGDGGGIRLSRVNGRDVERQPNGGAGENLGDGRESLAAIDWYRIDILNNIIVNNVTGLAGGAVSLQDAVYVNIVNNTVTNNDSTGTAAEAFPPGSPHQSDQQPAGIVARVHSAELAAAFGSDPFVDPYKEFSNPLLVNNTIWHNRTFYFFLDDSVTPPVYGLVPDVGAGDPPVYWDLAVLGIARELDPRYCVLTDVTGYAGTNISADPEYVAEYFNGNRFQFQYPTSIMPFGAFDEGGNWIDVRFGPLTRYDPATGDLFGDYHIQSGSPAVDAGDTLIILQFLPDLASDFDGETRPSGADADIGADEYQQ